MSRLVFPFALSKCVLCTCLACVAFVEGSELKVSRGASALTVAQLRHDAASEQLRQAHAAATRARAEYEKLVQERFDRRHAVAETAKTTSFVRNPEWSHLQSEMRAAVEKQRRLTERFTAAHPDMRAINLEIETLERSIRATPELIEGSENTAASQRPLSAAEFAAEFELNRQIEQARQDVSVTEDVVRAAQRQEQLAFEERVNLERRLSENVPLPSNSTVALPLIDGRLLQIVGVGLATLIAVLLGRMLKTPTKNAIKFSSSILSAFVANTRAWLKSQQREPGLPAKKLAAGGREKIVPRRRNQLSKAVPLHFNVVSPHGTHLSC